MLSLQNISPPLPPCYCCNEVPDSCFAMMQQHQQVACDLCDPPQSEVQGPGCLWRTQMNLLHVLNFAPSTHYLSHSLTGGDSEAELTSPSTHLATAKENAEGH